MPVVWNQQAMIVLKSICKTGHYVSMITVVFSNRFQQMIFCDINSLLLTTKMHKSICFSSFLIEYCLKKNLRSFLQNTLAILWQPILNWNNVWYWLDREQTVNPWFSILSMRYWEKITLLITHWHSCVVTTNIVERLFLESCWITLLNLERA